MVNLAEYDTPSLRKLKADIDKELASRRRNDARLAKQEMRKAAEKYGFSLSELVNPSTLKGGSSAPAKYQHPNDPSKTWSGRGRKPAWVKEYESSGRSLDELRI